MLSIKYEKIYQKTQRQPKLYGCVRRNFQKKLMIAIFVE